MKGFSTFQEFGVLILGLGMGYWDGYIYIYKRSFDFLCEFWGFGVVKSLSVVGEKSLTDDDRG